MAFKIALKNIFGVRRPVQPPAPKPTVAYELACASLAVIERLLRDRGDGVALLARELKAYLYTAPLAPDVPGVKATMDDLDYVAAKVRELVP